MTRRSGEVPPSGFEPRYVAEDEFPDAQLALIEIGRRQSGLTDPVDALNFVRAQIEIGGRRQRQELDEITAQVGRENRDAIFMVEAAKLGVSSGELKELLADPEEYRALMRMKAQAHLGDVETAQQFLAGHRRRTAELDEAALGRLYKSFDFSKPGRGDSHYGMNRLGKMVAAEMTAEKKAKTALKKQLKKDRGLPKTPQPKKPSWKQKLAASGKEAGAYFMATGEGIGPMKLAQLNLATGREAEVLEAERQLELWDKERERKGLDYAGFHWHDGET